MNSPTTERAPETTPADQQLRLRLQEAQAELARREAEWRAIESEWQTLCSKRARYEFLEHACQSIEKLSQAGIARVFWSDLASDDAVVRHLDEVRAKVADVARQVGDVEQRRNAAHVRVERQVDTIEIIDDDLLEVIEADERRRQEWAVERDESELPRRLQVMPWARRQEDDGRFRKYLLASVGVSVLLGLLLPYIDLPIPSREDVVAVPERIASFIRNAPRPMPPPPVHEEKHEKKPVVDPQVKRDVAPTQVARTTPEETPEPHKRAATGLLAFRESFSNLAQSRPSARLGAAAQINDAGAISTGMPERSMVATRGPGSSGGINLASLSRDVGDGGTGGRIEGVQLSRVENSIVGSGATERPLGSNALAGRTDEEIQIVFDRHKAALYRMYNRELRKDPTLRGQMVLKLTIEPDGRVSLCRLETSDMGAPLLADSVVERILEFDFGAKDVPSITIFYPIDFLPTA